VDVRKSLEFDIRHVVTKEDVITFFTQLKSDPAIRRKDKSLKRLDILEKHFTASVIALPMP
jgi:hypothetical protein